MDWLYSTGQAKDITQSFEILRDVPSQLTKRVKSISDAARDREQNAQGTSIVSTLLGVKPKRYKLIKSPGCCDQPRHALDMQGLTKKFSKTR